MYRHTGDGYCDAAYYYCSTTKRQEYFKHDPFGLISEQLTANY